MDGKGQRVVKSECLSQESWNSFIHTVLCHKIVWHAWSWGHDDPLSLGLATLKSAIAQSCTWRSRGLIQTRFFAEVLILSVSSDLDAMTN